MGCAPKMQWVKDCMDYYHSRHFILENGSYDMKALPFVISDILEEKYPQMLDTLFPCDWFNANELKHNNVTKNTFTIHHFKNSWAEEECSKEESIRGSSVISAEKNSFLKRLYFWKC